MRRIREIVVHYSHSDNPLHDDISVIKKWHTSFDPNDPTKPWKDVAYHLFIKGDATAQLGRPIQFPGAHCRGYNTYSIGICIHGKDKISRKQKEVLVQWINHYMAIFDLSKHDVYGHIELLPENQPRKNNCPGIDMDEIRRRLK